MNKEMKLWILEPHKEDGEGKVGPWECWYDKAFGFVVRAESEKRARELAEAKAGDESSEWEGAGAVWQNSKYTSCVKLTDSGEEGIVIHHYKSA